MFPLFLWWFSGTHSSQVFFYSKNYGFFYSEAVTHSDTLTQTMISSGSFPSWALHDSYLILILWGWRCESPLGRRAFPVFFKCCIGPWAYWGESWDMHFIWGFSALYFGYLKVLLIRPSVSCMVLVSYHSMLFIPIPCLFSKMDPSNTNAG